MGAAGTAHGTLGMIVIRAAAAAAPGADHALGSQFSACPTVDLCWYRAANAKHQLGSIMRRPITFRERARLAISQTAETAARTHTAGVFDNARRAHARANSRWPALTAEARTVRLQTLRNLGGYLEQLEAAVTARGGHVVWARDGDEAARYIVELARTQRVSQAVHSRTPLAVEIGLTAALNQANVRVQPTHVGDYLANLVGQRPAHPLASVANWHIDDAARVVHEQLDVPVFLNAQAIVNMARSRVRQAVLHSALSIVGVQFAIAETGSLVVLDEQADVRLAAAQVPVQVAIMGLEQVVPTVEDWLLLEQVYLGGAVGRAQLPHVDLLAGTSPAAEGREFHLILLDNGRSTLLNGPAAELLTCIQCGACVSACPISRRVGSEPYAWSLPGPLGAVMAAWLLAPPYADGVAASTLCGACRTACPLDIDLPTQLLNARHVTQTRRQSPPGLRWVIRKLHSPSQRTSLARWLATSRWLTGGQSRRKWLAPWLLRWTASRDLPPVAGTPFHERWTLRQMGSPPHD